MSEEIYFSGDEILVIDGHGITPYKILRVVKREFKLLTKYYYELRDSNGKIRWNSSLDLNNKTVVRITPENTCGAKPLPSKNDNPPSYDIPETPKTPFRQMNSVASKDCAIVTTVEPKPESLTGDTICDSAWYYNEYNLWFIETKVGNYIRLQFVNNTKEMVLIKTPATLKDLDLISPRRVNHSYYSTKVKDIFGDNFTVIG